MTNKNGWCFGAIVILLVVVSSGVASAEVTGWANPTSNVGGAGVISPENAYGSDSNYANFRDSPYNWIYYGYDLSSIPNGAPIDGIEINTRGENTFHDPDYMSVEFSWDGGATWTTAQDTPGWPEVITDHILGDSTDNWGHSWTRDEIVSSFRVRATWTSTRDARLYQIPVRVYYRIPTYNVSVTPIPASAGVVAGGNYSYPITVYNNGNADGSFTLVPSDSDSTNFSSSTVGTSPLYVTSGGSNSTTITVTAQGGATLGAVDITTVTVTSVGNSSYSNTTQVTTTVETPAPSVSVTLTPSSQSVSADYQKNYTVTVQNTGNVVDSYTLSINFANTSDLGYTLASTATGSLNPGQQYVTAMTVYGLSGATIGKTHGQSVTATGTVSDMSNGVTTTVAGLPKMLVATNRFVILDDAVVSGDYGADFVAPKNTEDDAYNSDNFDRTIITIWALLLDGNGLPLSNTDVIFTLKNPGSVVDTTSDVIITDENGLANFAVDLNAKNYYGIWEATANASGITDETQFIYNWWGCAAEGGTISGGCGAGHSNKGYDVGDPRSSPYLGGGDSDPGKFDGSHASDCTNCHMSYNGLGGNVSMNTAGAHSSLSCDTAGCHASVDTHATNMVIGDCTDCHSSANTTMKTILNGVSTYSTTSTYHNADSSIPCVICHGPMHNITKPDPSAGTLGPTEDSQCTTCHSDLSKHNDVVGCVECHSEDIHVIQYRQDDDSFASTTTNAVDCTDCHQGSGLASFNSAPTVAKISHSQNTQNGSLWSESRTGNFWISASEVTKCEYCHSDTKHKTSAIGRPVQFNGTSDIVGGGLAGAWCGLCHYQSNSNYDLMITVMGSGLVPPEITGNATYGTYTGDTASDAETGYFDHSAIGDYSDNSCTICHDVGNDVTVISDLMHNVSYGRGGPDCISCHDVGKYAPKVNVSSINTSSNIHSGLNSGAADTTGNTDNKICWGCHSTDGTQPGNDHPSKYKTPYTCYECHDGTPPSQASSALVVSNHFKSGTNLTSVSGAANNSASCLECHNKAEMKSSYTEPDSESNAQSLVSHYGIKRTTGDLSNYNTSTYCVYCHNATNEFAVLVTGVNASITNHSNSVSGPSCANSTCHNTGRIHDISLKIPTVTPTLCKSCHATKVEHNNSVACSECHMTDDTQIHAIRFLQPDESFSTVSATAVDCATCHQGGGLANFSNATDVGMVRHSQNTLNGTLWDRGSAFWTNTSESSKCEYCHGDSKHDAVALGYINDTKGSNTVGGDLTGTWCAGCHYQGDDNYDTMIATLSIVPPEITENATYGNYTTADDGTTNYFNHSTISGFTDADCATCHDKNASTMITPFMHNVSLNNGGTDCTACHSIGGIVTNVNVSEIVNGSHSGMNSDADLTGVMNGTQLCWSCHGDGSRPEEHPSNYNEPHYCDDCHTPENMSNPLVINETVPTIYRHAAGAGGRDQINKSQLVCENCHANMLVFSNPEESALAQVAHYTNNSPATGWFTCNDGCHKDVPLGAVYAGAEQTAMGAVGGVTCMYCHNYETVANGFSTPPLGEGRNATDGSVSIHNRSIVLISTGRCDDVGCHGIPNDPRLIVY